MKTIGWVAFILVVVGALNWGLVGIFDWNLVDAIFGVGSTITRIIYTLVGLSGLWILFTGSKMMPKE